MSDAGENRRKINDDTASDLWRNTLSQIESQFGRLAYLSSLRDPNSGRYEHFGLAQIFGESAADRTLRQAHEQAFFDWLCLTLQQQKADLDRYLSSLNVNRRTVLRHWSKLAPYRNLVPAEAGVEERDLYSADLEIILELMSNQYGVTVAERAACAEPLPAPVLGLTPTEP